VLGEHDQRRVGRDPAVDSVAAADGVEQVQRIENVCGVGYRLVGVDPTHATGARHETRAAAAQNAAA
jgi:hypothetical protein